MLTSYCTSKAPSLQLNHQLNQDCTCNKLLTTNVFVIWVLNNNILIALLLFMGIFYPQSTIYLSANMNTSIWEGTLAIGTSIATTKTTCFYTWEKGVGTNSMFDSRKWGFCCSLSIRPSPMKRLKNNGMSLLELFMDGLSMMFVQFGPIFRRIYTTFFTKILYMDGFSLVQIKL